MSRAESPVAASPPGAALVSTPVAYALAAVAGTLYFLSFPGFGWWPLGFVALVPLVVALEGRTPRSALRVGAVTGLALNVGGFSWMLGLLRDFSGFPLAACLGIALVLWAYQGGRLALTAWLHARATARGWPRALAFLLAFGAAEIAWPVLFPWYFGATLLPVPELVQVADVAGPYLVGWVLVAPALALAELILARARRTAPSRLALALGLAFPLVAAAYGAIRIRQTDARVAAAAPLHVGLAQGDMPLHGGRAAQDESVARHVELTRELRDRGAELVVWSEAAMLRPVPEPSYAAALQGSVARQLRVPTILGAVLYKKDARGFVVYNSALFADARGEVHGRYDKQFLLAFGEYIPFGETFPVLYDWSPNSGRMSAGRSFDPLLVGDHRVSTLICYEDILPGFVNRAVAHARPELLVNMTNDAWFGETIEPWEHYALSRFRAIEHRKYLVRATNSAVTAVVDPVGRTVATAPTFRRAALDATVHWMAGGVTPYEIVGDAPFWLVAALALTLALVRNPRGDARGSSRPVV